MANGTLKVSNIETSSGSGTITLGQSGETVDLSTATMTLNNTMKATPAFEAYRSSNQTISTGTSTKIQYDTEVFDTDSAYDNSTNYRFTPQTAGKYFIFASAQTGSTSDFDDYQILIYKNGSTYAQTRVRHHYAENINCQVIVDMNGSTDYVEGFAYQASGGNLDINGTSYPRTRFGGYRIIGA